jgi:diguanylate cyclase (GGDEF)-like protein/PAS domain S-box-containing protein
VILAAFGGGIAAMVFVAVALLRRAHHQPEPPLGIDDLFEAAPDALLVVDRHGAIVMANRPAGELFGWPRATLVGQPIERLVPHGLRERHESLRRGFLNRPARRRARARGAMMRGVRRDGSEFPLEITLSPLACGAVVAAVRDSTAAHEQVEQILSLNRMYSTLAETNQLIARCECDAELFDRVCEVAVRYGELRLAWIGQAEPHSGRIRPLAHCSASPQFERYLQDLVVHVSAERPEGRGPVGVAWREAHAVFVQDYRQDPRMAPWRREGEAVLWGSCAALPLRRGGAVYAVLVLYDTQSAAFSEKIRDLLERMVVDIEYALDRLDLRAERERSAAELRIAALAFESSGAMLVTDAEARVLRVNEALRQMSGHEPPELIGQPLQLLGCDTGAPPTLAEALGQVRAHGRWQGEIWGRRKSGEEFPLWLTLRAVSDGSGRSTHFIASLADLSDQKNTEQRISRLLNFDALTGLANRRFMLDRLRAAVQWAEHAGGHGAALLLGLDKFQAVNDLLGHQAGDILLQQTAERLRGALRGEAEVGRIGGDEFLVILEDLGPAAETADAAASRLAEDLLATVLQPHQIGGQMVSCSASIGIAPWGGGSGAGFNELLKRADVALHAAKDAGRNVVRLFCPSMQLSLERRSRLESRLRHEFSTDQLQLYYQRRVDVRGATLGAEALLRWHDPQRGVVSPLELVSAAEEIGLIHDIGRWTLEHACGQLKEWSRRKIPARRLIVAVNISPKQLGADGFVDEVSGIVERAGIDPSLLELEITEGLPIPDMDAVIPKIHALRRLGISFAIDDFGIGYSSLSYLRQLPISVLKIDRSFVTGMAHPGGETLVHTIVQMARSLDLQVIAEGVETQWQWDTLVSHGCDQYQGYLFGRPVPIEAFDRELAAAAG